MSPAATQCSCRRTAKKATKSITMLCKTAGKNTLHRFWLKPLQITHSANQLFEHKSWNTQQWPVSSARWLTKFNLPKTWHRKANLKITLQTCWGKSRSPNSGWNRVQHIWRCDYGRAEPATAENLGTLYVMIPGMVAMKLESSHCTATWSNAPRLLQHHRKHCTRTCGKESELEPEQKWRNANQRALPYAKIPGTQRHSGHKWRSTNQCACTGDLPTQDPMDINLNRPMALKPHNELQKNLTSNETTNKQIPDNPLNESEISYCNTKLATRLNHGLPRRCTTIFVSAQDTHYASKCSKNQIIE